METVMSDFLASRSGIIDGLATIFDFSGSFYDYNRKQSAIDADANAIRKDWEIVGKDLRRSIVLMKRELDHGKE